MDDFHFPDPPVEQKKNHEEDYPALELAQPKKADDSTTILRGGGKKKGKNKNKGWEEFDPNPRKKDDVDYNKLKEKLKW